MEKRYIYLNRMFSGSFIKSFSIFIAYITTNYALVTLNLLKGSVSISSVDSMLRPKLYRYCWMKISEIERMSVRVHIECNTNFIS